MGGVSNSRTRPGARGFAVAAVCAFACAGAAAPAASAQAVPPPPASPPPASSLTPAPDAAPSQRAEPSGQATPAEPEIRSKRGHTYWSRVYSRRGVRAAPNHESRVVGRIRPWTYYGLRDVVIVLEHRGRWAKIRFSALKQRVGWVPRSALGEPRLTTTWIRINRRKKTLRLYRGNRRLMITRVGVGAVGSPTPGGNYFIRERLVPRNKRGIYGVLAFGLSAYSKYRTDWPGGGQVGIHGTNQPGLIPGRISNGCVRLRNRAVRKLDRFIGPGTPVQIR